MAFQSKSKIIYITRFLLTAMLLIVASVSAAAQDTNTFPGSGNAGIGTTTFDSGTSGLQIRPTSRGKFGVLVTDTDGSRSGGLSVDSDGFGHLYLYDSSGTIKVRLAASGQDDTYFNSGGNVGIGTATPSQKLSVIGNGLFGNLTSRTLLYSTYDSQQNPFLEVGYGTSHSAITPYPAFVLSNNTTSTNNGEGLIGQFVFANRSIADNNDKRTAVITSWVDGASNSGTLQFYTNSAGAVAERLRINSAGNVGIGTTSPGSLLQIANAAQPTFTVETTGTTGKGRVTAAVPDWLGITQNARFDGANWNLDNTSVPGWLLKLDSRAGVDVFEIARFSAGTNPRTYTPLFTIDSAGDVGIGTNTLNVAYKLDVNGAINATGLNVNGSPVNGSQWANGTGSINYTSGNVGIGTTSPNTKLDVQGNLSVTGGGINDTVKVLSTSSVSGGALIQTTQASAQAAIYVENNRGSYASYGGLLYGGSSNANTNLFGVSRSDRMVLFADGPSNQGMAVGTLAAQPLILGTGNTERMRVDSSGNVGIGKTDPQYKLDVVGDIKASGTIHAKYQDLAEWVPSSEQLASGTVVVLDTTKSNQVVSSTASYDTRVAGVISTQPGITLGESGEGKVLVATTGRVRVKVDASRAIQIGDLLVTSDVAGVAMKSEAVNLGGVQFHRPGTIIGKALEPLDKGTGEILVLLSLQ